MPPVMEKTAIPEKNRISLEIPEEYCNYSFRVVIIPIEEVKKPEKNFSQFVGTINWKGGDPVAFQRSIRDEW